MVVYFSLSFLSPCCTPPGYQARQDQEEEQRQRLRRRPKTTALSRPVYVHWLRWPRLVPLGDKGWRWKLVSSLAYVRALKAGSTPFHSPILPISSLDPLGSTACPRHLNHWITLAHRSATGRIQVARCLEQKRRSMWSCKEQRCASASAIATTMSRAMVLAHAGPTIRLQTSVANKKHLMFLGSFKGHALCCCSRQLVDIAA